MNANEALCYMEKVADKVSKSFASVPFCVRIEKEFLTARLKQTADIKKARFISVSMVIFDSSDTAVSELYLTFSVELTKNGISDKRMENAALEYEAEAEAARMRISGSADMNGELAAMVLECLEEDSKLRAMLKSDINKTIIFSLAIAALCILAVVLTTLFA